VVGSVQAVVALMKSNPWTKRHPTPEQAREALFAAGWHPSMYMLPVTDPKIREAMRVLNEADVRRTHARIRAMS
jgi:hypothetical protein